MSSPRDTYVLARLTCLHPCLPSLLRSYELTHHDRSEPRLQVVRAPFAGACLGALGADAQRITLTDTSSRVHVFHIARRGHEPPPELPIPAAEAADGGPHAMRAASQPRAEAKTRETGLRQTREGRVTLALEAADYLGVVDALTRDDMAALVPEAYAHAAKHPAEYALPPEPRADSLVAEFEQQLMGRAPPLGPPHW